MVRNSHHTRTTPSVGNLHGNNPRPSKGQVLSLIHISEPTALHLDIIRVSEEEAEARSSAQREQLAA